MYRQSPGGGDYRIQNEINDLSEATSYFQELSNNDLQQIPR